MKWLIRARASSLNRADLLAASDTRGGVGARLGLECAGEVEAIGSGVTGVKAGDRVHGFSAGRLCGICRHRCRAGAPHSRPTI